MKKLTVFLLTLSFLLTLTSCYSASHSDETNATEVSTDETDVMPDSQEESAYETDSISDEPIQRVVYSASAIELSDSNIPVYPDPSAINLEMTPTTETVNMQRDQKNMAVNGDSVALTYSESKVYQNQDAPETILQSYGTDIYVDEAGLEYEFYAGTEMLSYFADWDIYESNASVTKDESEISELSDKLWAQYAPGLDMTLYEKSIEEDGGVYYVKYLYKFCGYDTDSQIFMTIKADGQLAVYHSDKAFIFRDWEGKITEEDIQKAAATVSNSSTRPSGATEQKLVMGDDGYMYLMVSSMSYGYTETDENGEFVRDVLPAETICYVRVIPES